MTFEIGETYTGPQLDSAPIGTVVLGIKSNRYCMRLTGDHAGWYAHRNSNKTNIGPFFLLRNGDFKLILLPPEPLVEAGSKITQKQAKELPVGSIVEIQRGERAWRVIILPGGQLVGMAIRNLYGHLLKDKKCFQAEHWNDQSAEDTFIVLYVNNGESK